MAAGLTKILDDWFDAAGIFKGRLPDDFFRFSDAVSDRTDLDLGEDARAHALHLASTAMHRAQAVEIRENIVQFGGQLPGIRARLYPYQVEGVAFLAANGRALLADDMGLGKTLQAIAAAVWLHRHDGMRAHPDGLPRLAEAPVGARDRKASPNTRRR